MGCSISSPKGFTDSASAESVVNQEYERRSESALEIEEVSVIQSSTIDNLSSLIKHINISSSSSSSSSSSYSSTSLLL